MKQIAFLNDNGIFHLENPENYNYLYFPIAGLEGLKSDISPNLGGDSKLDQESFLLEPVSVENLHNNRSTRNFWVNDWSAAGASAQAECQRFTSAQEKSEITGGLMWHTLHRTSAAKGLSARITSFVALHDNVEIMLVTVTNINTQPLDISPVAAIPIFGRSADNIRDHRNVTSMLHRIRTTENAVLVRPTMSFDEKGHRQNHRTYFVAAAGESGEAPESFYPTVDSFIGEGGTYTHPAAVFRKNAGIAPNSEFSGKEAMGGIRFPTMTVQPQKSTRFVVLMGITENADQVTALIARYGSWDKAQEALEAVKQYWQQAVNVSFRTGNTDFDNLMHWVCLQPFLRRIYGCSFLPYHDYGRGGRGWRDLWQDCLSLLLMDPGTVRNMIIGNCAGVRIDGTNATIIGTKPGEFIADRNGIARVWMDHGFWPLLTVKLYMDQTGDLDILDEQVPYFKDALAGRGTAADSIWRPEDGSIQKTEDGTVYTGTVLEHLLLMNLSAFHDVGAHNVLRLRGADWNDALDMANENGESVAFSFAYAGNLKQLARILRCRKRKEISVFEELALLLNTGDYSRAGKRQSMERFLNVCRHSITGKTVTLSSETLSRNLEEKADWLMAHLRRQEWLDAGWFNSYYDNSCKQVEGIFPSGVRMMLTGQVFAIMSGTATDTQIRSICENADKYLYRKEIGGYRLNTDFRELKFDMGRMFGFAYGEKENGSVFSHMTVMYAYALYQRGFVREGWKALKGLSDLALDFQTSRIYPGIPEYFNAEGRGMYPYLTGAASWYMMTMITQVFGVRGESGDLIAEPKLMAEQFDKSGSASILLHFADREFRVCIYNPEGAEYGGYQVACADCDGAALTIVNGKVRMDRQSIAALSAKPHTIRLTLRKK